VGTATLDAWAKAEGLDASQLRRMNPAYVGGRIARSERTQRVLAPMPATTAEAAATMVGAAAAGP
jgi:membrane-bound lytic murein transglycosylase D